MEQKVDPVPERGVSAGRTVCSLSVAGFSQSSFSFSFSSGIEISIHVFAFEQPGSDGVGVEQSKTSPICRVIFSVIRATRMMRSSFSARLIIPVRSTLRRDGPALRARPMLDRLRLKMEVLGQVRLLGLDNPATKLSSERNGSPPEDVRWAKCIAMLRDVGKGIGWLTRNVVCTATVLRRTG